MRNLVRAVAVAFIAGFVLFWTLASNSPQPDDKTKFVGAGKCKSCHKAEKMGNQYKKWEESKHAAAFKTLASEEAKKIAKAKNIADPQKSDACLKCHVTAFGTKEDLLDKKFDKELGVQCEACHGPGEKHVKARMSAEGGKPSADELKTEINKDVGEEACKTCHNSESPSYKEFKYEEFKKKIEHLKPSK